MSFSMCAGRVRISLEQRENLDSTQNAVVRSSHSVFKPRSSEKHSVSRQVRSGPVQVSGRNTSLDLDRDATHHSQCEAGLKTL